MSLHRRAAKRDASEPAIIKALEACGFSVERLSAKGVGDLAIGRQGKTRIVEVKTDDEPLNDNQILWWATWRGNGCIILRRPEDVVTLSAYWLLLDTQLIQHITKAAA